MKVMLVIWNMGLLPHLSTKVPKTRLLRMVPT